ncbi:glucosamine-6-phosphate deaminase [Cohnella rhizosphaerae]|uniref:Glucosamine-6-phosphate deaminase n=1 Tax=Cohnella rhizosphaerae TaxID=1457232 RepID=A0A9X4QTN7_9BACL|nr:glucosamine-6-phosphate deaminase [Cohnella rhizosphaerae]MDG0809637.1 glucosamine-6-phosphate deaminase [Cohnella rhizosphaerae]
MSQSMLLPVYSLLKDNLRTQVFADRGQLGQAACDDFAGKLRALLAGGRSARVVFAAAPSQNEFLDALAAEPDIDWGRVTAFHMDEYLDLPADAPQRFARYLNERLFDKVRPGRVHLMNPNEDAEKEALRYEALLREAPIDIVCLGIGENGHLAFNDPPADFDDPRWAKVVQLDADCRVQQVNDGCFDSLARVPTHALTMTIPALLSAMHVVCIVPGRRKRQAVLRAVHGPIEEACPASALRRHESCVLYADTDSYAYKRAD